MRSPNLDKWEFTKELEGMLFFAQSLDEMLFDHTIDTYKAPALNVRTSTFEVHHYANQALTNRIRIGALEPLVEELISRLQEDPVVSYLKVRVFSQYCKQLEQSKTKPQELINLCTALIAELDSYWDAIIEIIPKLMLEPKHKKEIREIASAFITEAEQNRFSREYIYYKTTGFFFTNDVEPRRINKVDQINDFLMYFKADPSNWQIYFQGSGQFTNLLELEKNWENLLDIKISKGRPLDLSENLKKDQFFMKRTDYPFIIEVKLPSDRWEIKEPVMAKEFARMLLDSVSDIYSFISHEEPNKLSEAALVVNTSNDLVSLIDISRNPMKKTIKRLDDNDASEMMRLFLDMYFGRHFEPKSTSQCISSFAFHKFALDTSNAENQLANLWTSLESLLPPPNEESARIVFYLNAILPAQTLTYSQKVFEYLFEAIKHSNTKIQRLIEGFDIPGDTNTKIVALVTLAEYQDLRNLVFSKLDKDPLLKNRIYEISESFSTKKRIRKSLIAHRQRVTWHVQRIYTLRNEVVHSGQRLPYASTLVENAHSYYDSIVRAISMIAKFSREKYSIASALTLLSVYEKNYLQILEGKDEVCNSDNFRYLIFGHENPLSPYAHSFPLNLKK